MRKCCVLLLFLLSNFAFSQVDKFRYQSEKSITGSVYHYIKSNADGSDPEHIAVYFASPDRIEVFKYHPEIPASRAALVIAEMDWSTYSVRRLESWAVTGADQKSLVAALEYLPKEQSVNVEILAETKVTERTKIPFLPFHVYNFDLTSLNFAMPYLVDPKAPFQIGLADPNFEEEGPIFLYRGEITIEFQGMEKRNGFECRKYRADGPGLNNEGGFLWVDQQTGHFVDLEFDLPDNPNWDNFKLKLDRIEKMSASDWTTLHKKHFQK